MTNSCDRPVTDCVSVTASEEYIIARLERAGKTLLAMPDKGYKPGLAQRQHEIVRSIWDAFSWTNAPVLRAPAPTMEDIRVMDEVLPDWVLLIPESKVEVRRIVQCRLMVHPLSGVHMYPWRRLGEVMHMDYKGVQRRHAQGIKIIYEGLLKRLTNGYENVSGAEMRH